jgi:hypothetical protein
MIAVNEDHFEKLYGVLTKKLSHLRQAQRLPPGAVIPAHEL